MNELLQAILLGALQGLTEFLPVSSSGHLQAIKALLDSPDVGDQTLDVFLHFATLLAVLLVFRSEFFRLVEGLFRPGESRQRLFLVVLGAIPAGVAGYLAQDWFEALGVDLPYVLPICWCVTAGALWTLKKPASDAPSELSVKTALWVGLWQILALFPGISRSGITIAAALWLRTRRDEAATYSFLIATPLILGATGIKVLGLLQGDVSTSFGLTACLVGSVVAFFTGWGALLLLLRMLRGNHLHRWSYYLLPVAVAYAIWLAVK